MPTKTQTKKTGRQNGKKTHIAESLKPDAELAPEGLFSTIELPGAPSRKLSQREIPRIEWLDFLDRFSEQHAGWLATLYVMDGDQQRLILAQDLPLHAVAASLEHRDHDTVSISFANTKTMMLEHNQSNVEHVYLLQTADGAHAGMLVEGINGERTLLLFRSPVLPETVDGVMTR